MKKEQQHIPDELLVKYLLGEADATEQAEITQWIAESDANRKYFEHFELIWNHSQKLAATSTVNEDEAWERFMARTRKEQQTAPKIIAMPSPQQRSRFGRMRAAAGLIALVGVAGIIYYMAGRSPDMIALQTTNNTLVQTLPDGSTVTLNKMSSLSYPENFDGDLRQVELEGEAFFNVAPDKSKPFVIHSNEASVTVVGTSFNVKTTEEKTEVIVETGIVEVAKKDFMVKLNPHEKATVLKGQDKPLKTSNDDELYNYYRTKEFVCNGTPLWRLADVLSEAYGVRITVSDRLKNQELTTTFQDRSLDSILAVLGETFNADIEKREGAVFIK